MREVEELHLIKDKYPILGWPIIRGAVTFVDSMVRGVKALMFSADYFPELEESERRSSTAGSRRTSPSRSSRA